VVSALGLGEIELKSGLNQPLAAEIGLNNLGDLNEQQIAIKLAGADDFARAGVERVYFLNDLKFTIQFDGKGNGVIAISSKKLVREPYLDFVLEARWPEGRLLREYTLLIDLPTFSEAAVAAPAPAASSQRSAAEPTVKTRVPTPAPSAASLPAAVPANGEILSRKNDTLWGIAARARPAGASMQQAMMAIYRNNPQAFARQNINGLRSGQILRMPSPEQIDSMSKQQAIQAVAMQNEAWKTGTSAPLEAAETTAVQDVAPQSEAQSYMKLANAAGSEASSAAASAGADEGGDLETVRSELIAVQEKLDQTGLENSELESRLDDMEAQVDTLEKLVELKDSQLAAMQSRLEQEATGSAEPVDLNYESGVDAAPASTAVASDAAETQPNLLDRLMSPLYLGGFGVLALLGLAALLKRRRAEDDDAVGQSVVDNSMSHPQRPEAIAASSQIDATDEEVLETLAAAHDDTTGIDAAPAAQTQPAASSDPLAEAEIYCSDHRHDEAVAMLQKAIGEEPERTELHLKLLSIFADLGRESEFVQLYGELGKSGNEDSLQLAQQLVADKDWLEQTAAADTQAAQTTVSDEIDDADLDFDLDFDLDEANALDNTSQHTALDLAVDDLDLEDTSVDLDDLDFDIELNDDDDPANIDPTALANILDGGADSASDKDSDKDSDSDTTLSEMIDGDEIATKLDLARAYVDMGDVDGARDILDEVLQDGSDVQIQEANELLRDLAS
jgi:pilus assembly protein FimV